MSRTPMPSPNNTNRAGLFLQSGSPAAAAYDAAPDDGDVDYSAVLDFIESKLDPADFAKVKSMLGLVDENSGASDAARRTAYASDSRALHRGGHITIRELERRLESGPPRQHTAADEARVKAMFPNAGRLR